MSQVIWIGLISVVFPITQSL